MKNKSQKGSSLMVVFIICIVIGILLSTTFIVTGNYSRSVMQRKKSLQESVCAKCVVEEEDPSESVKPNEPERPVE